MKTRLKWQALELTMQLLSGMGNVVVGPPSLDKTALAELRTATRAAFDDATFQAEATKVLGSAPTAVNAATASKIAASLGSVDPKLVAHLKAHVASGSSVKQ